MEAIIILLAYKLCLGLLSSAVIATGTSDSAENIRINPNVINSTAQVAQQVSLKTTRETENISDDCETENAEEYEENFYEDDIDQILYTDCFSDGFDSSFKAYMDYRCITDTSSVQYSLQQQAYTDERGFRKIGDDYCVALGTGITSGCGERFLITLDSGYSFTAIVSDIKADIHTDETNCYAPRGENAGNIVEFIIDSDNADGYMLTCGSAGCFDDLSGNVESVVKI